MRRAWLAVLVALLAGCGGGSGDTIRLSAVALNATDPFWVTVACGARAEATRLGVRLDWNAVANVDVRAQALTLQAALLKRPHGLIFVPASQTAFIADVERVMRDGIPVDIVSGRLARPSQHRRIGTDLTARGPAAALAARLLRRAGSRGSVAILAGRAGTVLDEPRRAGFEAALARLAPGIEVLPPEYPETDRTKAATTVAALLARHRDLIAVYATSGPEGIGAAQAVRESGRDVAVYAYDAMPEEVAALRRGDIDALLAQSPELMGREAVRSLTAYARSQRRGPVPSTSERTTPTLVLTAENVDSPAAAPFLYRSDCRP